MKAATEDIGSMRMQIFSIEKCVVPEGALLTKYTVDGTYTDCYTTKISTAVSFPEFVFAFYTTFLFKMERFILTWTVTKPSTDAEAKQLADNTRESFAAWTVEDRRNNEILMCDFVKRTRSWLMVIPENIDGVSHTRLYFGSAVVPVQEKQSLEFGFRALLGFHRIYSIALLYFAKARLKRQFLS